MSHARQQIREKFESLLTGLTTTGSNVTASRVYSIGDSNLPHLSIYSSNEELDRDKGVIGDKEFRLLSIVVEARAKQNTDLDDKMDTIAAEVEKVVFADDTLGDLVKDTTLESTEIELDGEGEKKTGLMTMTFVVSYRINRTNPEVIIN
jgi:hypothetical protein